MKKRAEELNLGQNGIMMSGKLDVVKRTYVLKKVAGMSSKNPSSFSVVEENRINAISDAKRM